MIHELEVGRPSNTGHVVLRHDTRYRRSPPLVPVPYFDGDEIPLLLYPSSDAEPLENYRHSVWPVALVVPDGTWWQTAQIAKVLGSIQTVALPLRRPGLTTAESISAALRILEGVDGPAVEAAVIAEAREVIERRSRT